MAHIADRWYKKDRTKTSRHGKGLRWQVEWVEPSGAKRKKSFQNKDLAEDFLTEIRHEIKTGVYREPQRDAVTVHELFGMWVDSHLTLPYSSERAYRHTQNTMLKGIGHLRADTLTRKTLQAHVNELSRDYAPLTVRNSVSWLSGAFKWGILHEHVAANPCTGVTLPKVPRKIITPLTPEEVWSISEKMPVEVLRIMVLVVAATGMRMNELRSVTWSKIRGNYLTVDRQLHKRTNVFVSLKTASSTRRILLGDATLKLLTDFRETYGGGEMGLVFHREGKPLSQEYMLRHLKKAVAAAEVTDIGWHAFRHFHASQLIGTGLSPVAVADRLGHSDVKQTLHTYAHLWPSDSERMAAAGDSVVTLRTPSERNGLRAISGM